MSGGPALPQGEAVPVVEVVEAGTPGDREALARLSATVWLAATEADVPKWLRTRAQADRVALSGCSICGAPEAGLVPNPCHHPEDALDGPYVPCKDPRCPALSAPVTEPGRDLLSELTQVVRDADFQYRDSGGSSRHWVRDCFLPALEAAGMSVVLSAVRDAGEEGR